MTNPFYCCGFLQQYKGFFMLTTMINILSNLVSKFRDKKYSFSSGYCFWVFIGGVATVDINARHVAWLIDMRMNRDSSLVDELPTKGYINETCRNRFRIIITPFSVNNLVEYFTRRFFDVLL